MKTLVVLLLLLPALAFGQGYFDGYTEGYGAAQSPEVITTIYSGRATFPNSFVDTTGIDVINMADDGSTIRYGYVRSSLPDNVYTDDYTMIVRGTTYERQNGTLPLYQGAVWYSLNGVNPGDRIVAAKTHVNSAAFSTNLMNAGAYVTCRVDTVAADYGVLDGASTTTDACLFDMSYNNMDATSGSTPWDPPLADRDSWYHYGPRSRSIIYGDVFGSAPGDSTSMKLVDAIQQIADRGQEAIDRGLLVWHHSIGQTVNWQITCGNHATHVPNGGGNPALTITTSSRRGNMVWDNGKIPVSVMIDDNNPGLVGYYSALSGDGVNFEQVTNANTWYARIDSLYSAENDNIDIVFHTVTHPSLGELTGSDLNYQLSKEAWMIEANPTVKPDTSYMNVDFAWTGGDSTFCSAESLWKIPTYGYKSARGTNLKEWATCPVGDFTPLSWDNYTNIYTTTCVSLSGILETGGSPETDAAVIKDNLLNYVDQMYTDYGRAALMTYGHDEDDGILTTNLATLKGIIEDCFFLERDSYGNVVDDVRARGITEVAAVIAASNGWASSPGDSVKYYSSFLTSTRQDSFATAFNKRTQFDMMWIEPAEE